MKALRLQQLCGLVLAGISTLAFSALGGDKIVFSEEKSQATEPGKDLRLGNELFKGPLNIDHSVMDHDLPGLPLMRRGPALSREEQMRLKLKRDQDKNWLLLEPGELERRNKEESTLGVKNRPLDDFNKKGDYTFYRVGEPKTGSGTRQPGELRNASGDQEKAEARQAAQQQRNREEADEESRHQTKVFELGGSIEPGAHTSSELNFNPLLDPAQKEALSGADGSKGDFSLRNLIGTTPGRTKAQQARMDEFNKLLNTPTQPQNTLAGFSQPGVSPPPAFATRPVEAAPARPSGGDLFRQNPSGLGSAPSRLEIPGIPTLNNNASLGASPFQRQMPAGPDTSKDWMKPIEPQRRKF